MAWQDRLKGDSLSWLLETDSPGVRYLAMRDMLDLPARSAKLRTARQLAHTEGPIAKVLAAMDAEGFWVKSGPGYNPKFRSSVWAITLLAQLGASAAGDTRITQACNYMLEHTLVDSGQFTMTGAPSGTVDCLQGNLCWALQELGCTSQRLDAAFEWMARTVTGEGIAPATERDAPVRYYSMKSGPTFQCIANANLSCAWGGIKVLMALGQLPAIKRTDLIERAIQHGVDFLLSTDPAQANYPAKNKPSPHWWKFSFPLFYVTDLLQNVEVLTVLGYGRDPRLEHAWEVILEKQDEQGRWALEHDYAGRTWGSYGASQKPNKWVTLRVLRVLKRAFG